MTKILICGLCPLPFENTLRSFGPGIRTWQFAHSLAAAGHRVHLLAMKIRGSYEAGEAVRSESRDGVEIERLDDREFFDAEWIARRIDELRPEALVGATIYGSHALAVTDPMPLMDCARGCMAGKAASLIAEHIVAPATRSKHECENALAQTPDAAQQASYSSINSRLRCVVSLA